MAGLNKARFLSRASGHDQSPDACWEWTGSLNSSGYGRFWLNGRITLAHRAAYFLFRGDIPEGRNVCHSCDNRRCVNPAHLWLGSQSENLRDAVAKGRMRPPCVAPERNGNAKLGPNQVREIRAFRRAGAKLTELATRFGVSPATISGVANRTTWKDRKYG